MFLFNAFSLNMVSGSGALRYKEITADEAKARLAAGFESAIGHQDMANTLSSVIGVKVPMNRVSNSLKAGDEFVVAQYKGPRLPEGATTLPEGARIVFFDCKIE